MNKELIEKLKDPKQATNYILRTKEEREILYKAKLKGCALVLFPGPTEPEWITAGSDSTKVLLDTLILNPDYQPEPEYIEIDIVIVDGWLKLKEGMPDKICTRVADCVIHPRFVGFFTTFSNYENGIALPGIATRIREGHKVYARFVKE